MYKMIYTLFFSVVAATFAAPVYAGAHTITVAVIDTGLNIQDPRLSFHLCHGGHRDFTGEGLMDNESHGTHIVGLIEKYARDSDYCLYIIKYYNTDDDRSYNHEEAYINALEYALSLHPDIINFSGGSPSYLNREDRLIRDNPHTIFITAAGNDGHLLTKRNCFYPACLDYRNVVSVGNLEQPHRGCSYRNPSSNYGPRVDLWEVGTSIISTVPDGIMGIMSGTSQATAITTGKWVYAFSHPGSKYAPPVQCVSR